jgi:hypothetical protein
MRVALLLGTPSLTFLHHQVQSIINELFGLRSERNDRNDETAKRSSIINVATTKSLHLSVSTRMISKRPNSGHDTYNPPLSPPNTRTLHPSPEIESASGIRHPASGIQHPASSIQHPASTTLIIITSTSSHQHHHRFHTPYLTPYRHTVEIEHRASCHPRITSS